MAPMFRGGQQVQSVYKGGTEILSAYNNGQLVYTKSGGGLDGIVILPPQNELPIDGETDVDATTVTLVAGEFTLGNGVYTPNNLTPIDGETDIDAETVVLTASEFGIIYPPEP